MVSTTRPRCSESAARRQRIWASCQGSTSRTCRRSICRAAIARSSAHRACCSCWLKSDAARETLRRCFAHLEPGGAFVTPFFFDWREGEPLDTGWEPLFTRARLEDGATVRSWVREWREPARQWWHTAATLRDRSERRDRRAGRAAALPGRPLVYPGGSPGPVPRMSALLTSSCSASSRRRLPAPKIASSARSA